MKLVVGLGNPGAEYRDTRHNVGFRVVDELARRWGIDQWRESFEALTARTVRGAESVLLAKPVTFMNLSGRSVAGLAGFYKIEASDLLVLTDDAALPLGRLRARREGSDGGHNGLKSTAQALGTERYARLRIGVGRGEIQAPDGSVLGRPDMADHVLGRFRPEEHGVISAVILRAADAAEVFITDGVERVMHAFNGPEPDKDSGKQDGKDATEGR